MLVGVGSLGLYFLLLKTSEAGDFLVIGWGVALYALRNLWSSWCQLMFSSCAVSINFPRFFIKFSAMPFAQGVYGIFFVCLKPMYLAYCLNWSQLNGVLLSLVISDGIPKYDRILSSAGMHASADVECTISTAGYLE